MSAGFVSVNPTQLSFPLNRIDNEHYYDFQGSTWIPIIPTIPVPDETEHS